jgi:hypothetical protein
LFCAFAFELFRRENRTGCNVAREQHAADCGTESAQNHRADQSLYSVSLIHAFENSVKCALATAL